MIFLDPRPRFVTWLMEYAAGRLIVDMGSGRGALLTALWTRGYQQVLGVDPLAYAYYEEAGRLPDYPFHRVLSQRGEDCTLARLPGLVMVFARPSHGGWVERVIDRVHPTADVLYISKPKNCTIDLYPFTYTALKTPTPGKDRERVYRVHHNAEEIGNTSDEQERDSGRHSVGRGRKEVVRVGRTVSGAGQLHRTAVD